jgi:FkbM family methyltransferase
VYEAYLRTLRRDVLRARDQELDHYRSILCETKFDGVVFDVGANLGDKAEVFRRLPAKVVCFEPDRSNIRFLKQRFVMRSDVTIVGNALSDKVGQLTFNVFEDGDALNTASSKWVDVLSRENGSRFGFTKKVSGTYEVDAVTLDMMLEGYGPAQYVKVDVEGLEVNVLRGLSRSVPFLSFEANLPEFREETLECVDRLFSINPRVMFNYDIHFKLEMPKWVGADEFRAWLSTTDTPYMEVWARN